MTRTQARLLPCEHALLTFTLPSELRPVAHRHQRAVYAALLREAAAAVQTLGADPQWVGGTVGILAVLHTWTRTLEYHPHAHLLVAAGGLTADGEAWRTPAHARFLMPGYALSTLFRAKMRAALARAGLLAEVNPRVWRRRWTVHVAAVGSGQHATQYLSRYIYRVAITDQRIERVADDRVTFRYTHARTGEPRRVTAHARALPGSVSRPRAAAGLSQGPLVRLAQSRAAARARARAGPPHRTRHSLAVTVPVGAATTEGRWGLRRPAPRLRIS